MTPKIVVVGSANTDFVIHLPHFPSKGETALGDRFQVVKGGKGANQAVAAARLGSDVTFVARLGDDTFGHEALSAYQEEGIHTDCIVLDKEAPSGVALIMVSQEGENLIAVAPGANGRLSAQDVLAAESAIAEADCLLLQLEIPLETVRTAAELAHAYQVRVILNPAPAQQLSTDFLKLVDVLTPNEREAAFLAGMGELGSESPDFSSTLSSRIQVSNLIVTLGANGVCILSQREKVHIPAVPVTPVDTTAAGDAFNGALAVALARGESLFQAVAWANAAGAISTTRAGAQPSLPAATELEQFIASMESFGIESGYWRSGLGSAVQVAGSL
jgi:ribokinase